jgi:4-carboxymuconolactone decarboxylase
VSANTSVSSAPEKNIEALAHGDRPVLEQLAQMTIDTRARSGLDKQTYILVRIAALIATDAAPVSYLVNLGAAGEVGVPVEDIQGTLVAVAPIVGTARIVSAASKMISALGIAEEISERDGD